MANQDNQPKVVFKDSLLDEKELKDFKFVQKRIGQLQQGRKNHYGVDLDQLWADADRDYVPHRLGSSGKRVVATDEERGWRGSLVQLGSNDWQSDIAQPNAYIKIQAAMSILIDQNPSGVFTPTTKKYQATTELMRQLYQRSWDFAKSKQQLKLFVFNLAKYGWAIARTYPLRITRKVKVLKEYDQDAPDKNVYDDKDIVEFNDIMRESLDPRNAWIDDMTKPNDRNSMRDWAWRKVYALDAAEEEFGKYDFWKYVQPGGNTEETINTKSGVQNTAEPQKHYQEENLVEILFYENRLKDIFHVHINGVPVIMEPLPISDARGNKKLSCWQTYWNIRHAMSPYGIGINEAIRYDQGLKDRIRNMTVDQLTMSIYKMFFFTGTQSLTDTGDIRISPGVGKQVLNPKDINWLEVPGPGLEAYKGLEMVQKDIDTASGITDPLLGEVTGKTAFEIAQAKESALKRLKTPLDNILDALNEEGYITVSLIQLLYSIPETFKVADQTLIEDYMKEIKADPELYEDLEPQVDEFGNEQRVIQAKVYPEFPLNLGEDEGGNLIETGETQFFRIKPKFLTWEGVINIKSQSLLSPSKQVDKALNLEMYNMLIPLLGNPMGPAVYGKIARNIVKDYDKDPRDILPDMWLSDQVPGGMAPSAPGEEPLIIPAGANPAPQGGGAQPPADPMNAQTQVSSTQLPSDNPTSIVGKIASRLAKPFRG